MYCLGVRGLDQNPIYAAFDNLACTADVCSDDGETDTHHFDQYLAERLGKRRLDEYIYGVVNGINIITPTRHDHLARLEQRKRVDHVPWHLTPAGKQQPCIRYLACDVSECFDQL